MNKDIAKVTSKALASESLSKDAGRGLALTGAGGLGLWALAGFLPFISLPVLLVLTVLLGGYLWVK